MAKTDHQQRVAKAIQQSRTVPNIILANARLTGCRMIIPSGLPTIEVFGGERIDPSYDRDERAR